MTQKQCGLTIGRYKPFSLLSKCSCTFCKLSDFRRIGEQVLDQWTKEKEEIDVCECM